MENETEQIFIINPSENQSSTQKLIEIPGTTQDLESQNVEDFSNACRTCASNTEFVIPIFDGEGLQNNLAEKIHKHLPIQVSEHDVLPRVVCYQCASTLLAWHELVQCCIQADNALRTRLTALQSVEKEQSPIDVEAAQTTEAEPQNKWNTSLPSHSREHDSLLLTVPQAYLSDLDHSDDEPLSKIAIKKSNTAYRNFYNALVNFRNHFVEKHDSKCTDPETTDSTDSEVLDDKECEVDNTNVDNFDDLSECNMRKGRMDDETRLELNQVQIKINGKIFYTCKICGKNLSSSHTYVFHKRIHTDERPCICHICGKQFRAPNGLQRHLTETHERVRRHSCRYCPKTFANTQNLKQHIRIHTGERPFICSHCGKRFTQSGSLHVHLKTHSEHFPFNCAECGAKFRLRSALSRHKLKHSGERPHVCIVCGKGFRQMHELNSHSICHTDLKPHNCNICGAAFRQRRALRHHTRRTHANDITNEITHPLAYNHLPQY